MIAAVLLIDPAFFYPRLQTDPLNYWLKAKSLVENGTTSARWAVNIRPFAYAAMPGVIRAPLLMLFNGFDAQLRAIQIMNIPISALVALLSAYIFSWSLPQSRHWLATGFAFVFTLFNPVWVANVFLPLVDAPYALFTLICIVLSVRLFAAPVTRSRGLLIAAYVLCLAIAFPMRFTAPLVLVFALTLILGRSDGSLTRHRRIIGLGAVAIILLAFLVVLNADAIFGRYFKELSAFVIKGDKLAMFLNVAAAAIPSQIVPTFMQGFLYVPIYDYFKGDFFGKPMQAAWTIVGLCLTTIAVTGIWRSRARFLPEILYLLAGLPILGLMMPSTSRYLKSYQGFIWIFFFSGAAWIYERNRHRFPSFMRTRGFAISAVASLALIVAGIRAWRMIGTASEKKFAVSVTRAPDYVTDVATTFRGLRGFIETLPADRTLLISDRGSMGRWKVISGRDYYYPDSTIAAIARSKDVYLVVECGTMEGCQIWNEWRKSQESRIDKFGAFAYDSVYAISRPRARVEVYRIRSID
jgi:hypothetical protein